jgi:hypothetical protein
MLTEDEARAEVRRILDCLARWPEKFAEAGVSTEDIEECDRYVRVPRLAAELAALTAPAGEINVRRLLRRCDLDC